MGMNIYKEEEELDELRIADEKMSKKLSIAEKKAAIKELKKRHGVNWSKFAEGFGKGDWFRISSELKNSVMPPSRRM